MMTRGAWTRRAWALAALVTGCAPIEGPSVSTPPPAAEVPADPPAKEGEAEGTAPAPSADPPAGSDPPTTTTPPTKAAPTLEVVLSGRPIQAFAIGASHVFTLESDVMTRLVATAKAPPHAVDVLVEEDILDGVRFESVGASRGRVFVVDSYGAIRSMLPDGKDAKSEFVPGAATRILAAPQTLWLADLPQFLGDSLVFRWWGANPSQVTAANAQLFPTGSVGDVVVDDDALVYGTRGTSSTLRSWAPAVTGTTGGHRLIATLPSEGGAVALDAQRAYVHLPATKEIRGYDRTTGASTTILAATIFDASPMLRSDGTNLYILTETALRRCSLTSCASTMTVLASGLVAARAVALDATHAWIVMTTKGQPGKIARIAK